MIHLFLLFLTTAGFALLCLSRERHQRDLVGRKVAARTANHARWIGVAILAAAFAIAGNRLGWAVGTLEWLGLSSIGSLLTMALLSRRSGRVSVPR
ncbi:MAG: DUF3325 domain-containing protein [Sphingopyxis sp.]|nr:DUF3325 domain-containing protein [Sphingopyxis sp.]